ATGAWPYHFDFWVGGMGVTLRQPWPSAMAQGEAISLLTRLGHVTGDRRFARAARRALAPLARPVWAGGVLAHLGDHPFFEEYPTNPPSFALNGFMFTLVGLYDLGQDSPAARRLFLVGMRTLEANLHLYDTGGISAYHLGW